MVDYVHMQYGHEYAYVEALALHVQKWALVGSEYQDNTCSTMTSSFSKVHVYTLYCVVCIPHSAHGSLTLRNFHYSQKYFTENFCHAAHVPSDCRSINGQHPWAKLLNPN